MIQPYDDDVVDTTEHLFGALGQYPDKLQDELLQLTANGDAKRNSNWVHQFNEGYYAKAADSLLVHRDYMDYKSAGEANSTTKRLEKANKTMIKYDGGFGDD